MPHDMAEVVRCATCGHEWPSPVLSGRVTVRRCSYCPPPPTAPDTHSQLEDLLNEVRDNERRMDLQDRLDLMDRQR